MVMIIKNGNEDLEWLCRDWQEYFPGIQELRNLKSGKDTFRFVYIMWIEPSYYAIYITTFIL